MEFCFYHPVGSHSGEGFFEIVNRKREDIKKYGYTLWSFSKVGVDRLRLWKDCLKGNGQEECDVICCGKNSKDPLVSGKPYWVKEYSNDLNIWNKVPDKMTSYQKFPKNDNPIASAFLVYDIKDGGFEIEKPKTWFMSNSEKWESEQSIPTRGEYLIYYPEIGKGRKVKIILKTREPFIVYLK